MLSRGGRLKQRETIGGGGIDSRGFIQRPSVFRVMRDGRLSNGYFTAQYGERKMPFESRMASGQKCDDIRGGRREGDGQKKAGVRVTVGKE